MNWYALSTDPMREAKAVAKIAAHGVSALHFTAVRSRAVSKHTKARIIYEVPLIARMIFVNLSHEGELPPVKYVKGFTRNATGAAFAIRHSDMLKFIETHSAWLETERKRHSPRERRDKSPKQVKLTSFEQLAGHLARLAGGDKVDFETGEIL